MEPIAQLLLVLLGIFLVFLNGFFVASEFSIVKVRETRIQELVQQGSRGARTAQLLIGNMDEYLSATQLGITLASLALGWVGEPAFATLFEPLVGSLGMAGPLVTHSLASGAAFLLITFLHIVLGELAPKSLAIQRPESVVLWLGMPLRWFYRASYPFIWALNGTANFLLRLVGITPIAESDRGHSEEELRLILAHSHEKGVLDRDERRLLERVFDFADRSVRQVMLPSVDVSYLDVQKDLEANLERACDQGHTRYPLCDGSLDKVVGLIHVKDLFRRHQQLGDDFALESLSRPVVFVPETKDIMSLLSEFRASRTHMAVVVDEFGTMVGIVTMEDILEELVGEIQDEFDSEKPPVMIRSAGERLYMVYGRALLDEVEPRLGFSFEDEENDTVGGHIMMKLGRTAVVGDEVLVPGRYRLRVVGMKGLQITDVLLELLSPPGE